MLIVSEGREHSVVRVRVEGGHIVEHSRVGLDSFPYVEHAFELGSAEMINVLIRRQEGRKAG